jgi:hypothetical protein
MLEKERLRVTIIRVYMFVQLKNIKVRVGLSPLLKRHSVQIRSGTLFIRLDRHSGTLYGNPFTGQSKVTTLEPIVSGSMVPLIGKYKKDLSCNLLQLSLASDQKEKGGLKKTHKQQSKIKE